MLAGSLEEALGGRMLAGSLEEALGGRQTTTKASWEDGKLPPDHACLLSPGEDSQLP